MQSRVSLCVTAAAMLTGSLLCGVAGAAGDMTAGDPIRVTVRLGTDAGDHRFIPDALTFETGKLYALRVENPGKHNYYFGSQSFADAVYSRKVVALDKEGKDLIQVYGPVRRVEIKAGNAMEWWFVPLRTGKFDDLRSTKTHSDAGMTGTIEIR